MGTHFQRFTSSAIQPSISIVKLLNNHSNTSWFHTGFFPAFKLSLTACHLNVDFLTAKTWPRSWSQSGKSTALPKQRKRREMRKIAGKYIIVLVLAYFSESFLFPSSLLPPRERERMVESFSRKKSEGKTVNEAATSQVLWCCAERWWFVNKRI